ncbi:COP23 domain-containing protein [Xenococcus sp. PCC 7305]|uniref:COP23 domain-containing protein n=1 Tax=Xenococcus sp. PCC 7305 TaxID=102125 RepID=UPI00068A7DEE|nr:COP23 domain-containing protein [Xenococcus sp. PCC 7305]
MRKFIGVLFTSTAVITSAIMINQPSRAQSMTFRCQPDNSANSIPTTYAVTPDGTKPVIKWKSDYFEQSAYTPMRRCNEVTERFNNFYSQGMLQDLTPGWVNKQPVVCATLSCTEDTLLFTLRPDQDPDQVLQELFANRQGASTPTFQCSTCSPSYNLQDYLDKTPVETPGSSTNSVPSEPLPSKPTGNTTTGNGNGTW